MADYSKTLFLPQTEFGIRANPSTLEPALLARWKEIDLERRRLERGAGRPRRIVHDGPPYANGNIHIGHARNKILKDVIVRANGQMGFSTPFVPGWDCHGLPIEWKVEEHYRGEGKSKDEVPVLAFRAACRAFAERWVEVQRGEFERLGMTGDWTRPYTTMAHEAEARIAGELLKFHQTGQLYRGSKPVMWSVVEKTSLAEAEVDYAQISSDAITVGFHFADNTPGPIGGARLLIWTTTPWTIPANRAVAYGRGIRYGVYRITQAPEGNWSKPGETYVIARSLAADVFATMRVEGFELLEDLSGDDLDGLTLKHPLYGRPGYDFPVPLLHGDHVVESAGTGFVHTAPSHGREDFDVWTGARRDLDRQGIDPSVPDTVDGDGVLTKATYEFAGRRVLNADGSWGDANQAVIDALVAMNALVARARHKHDYPHSWRSKKPVIFRATPQWFIAMDRWSSQFNQGEEKRTLREVAMEEIGRTEWVPPQSQNRITAMIKDRPDWLVSRQRAWGVPIPVFVHKETGSPLMDEGVDQRIIAAFNEEGADAWFKPGAAQRFLGKYNANDFEQVMDVLDVWFDSGCTHAFVLNDPATFPEYRDLTHRGVDRVIYLEGSDQHRGWFQSSLLESCGTRVRAPFHTVITHGFILDEHAKKQSKSGNNALAPATIVNAEGADVLRLWSVATDYTDDQKLAGALPKVFTETYKKLRNTLRWMLGTLTHLHPNTYAPTLAELPELERYMLDRLARVNDGVLDAYQRYDFSKVVSLMSAFMSDDLSSFYFDIRKDTLYCDGASSPKRTATLQTIETIFDRVVVLLAPILPFTCEEAFLHRARQVDEAAATTASVHLQGMSKAPVEWTNVALEKRWEKLRLLRRVAQGAIEIARREPTKAIKGSLDAHLTVWVRNETPWSAVLHDAPFQEICIVSGLTVCSSPPALDREDWFMLPEVQDIAISVDPAAGKKCARSWKYSVDVGRDAEFPDVTPRDADALREWHRMHPEGVS